MAKPKHDSCDECGYDIICFNPEAFDFQQKWTHAPGTPIEFLHHAPVPN